MPHSPTGHHAAWMATGGEATGRRRSANTPSVVLRELRIIGRAVRPSSGAWIHQAPAAGMEARRAETRLRGSVHDSPAGDTAGPPTLT